LAQHIDRWMDLAQQAADEQDPEKLHSLVLEINEMLERKAARLKGERDYASRKLAKEQLEVADAGVSGLRDAKVGDD
jgi:hypothetical protein